MTNPKRIGIREIVEALDLSKVSESYQGKVEITNIKKDLGTGGNVLVVRGDKVYEDRVGIYASPKFWIYENLLKLPKVQEQLRENPDGKLFDGVGFSSLEAMSYHADREGRDAVFVMAREMVPNPEVFSRHHNRIEIIHGDGPAEEGYVNKQAEVLSTRRDLIPMHQALNGARALAPVGNKVADTLEDMSIIPDKTFWCMASGSNLYGIGSKIKERFGSETVLVEPEENYTIDPNLDLSNPEEVRDFAKNGLRNYNLDGWDGKLSGIFPLHAALPNRYMMVNWSQNGNIGFDETIRVPKYEVDMMKGLLGGLSQDYGWTDTTALTLVPAVREAAKGKNVLVMAYGRDRS